MDRDAENDYREFVIARTPALLGTAYLLTGDLGIAEDLLQATLLQVYRHWGRVAAAGNPESYVRRVMTNQRITWWRRRRVAEWPTDAVPERKVADGVAGLAERDEMWRALQQLPARARAVLVLRYWEDLSEADTARILGCSVGTVKSQSSRGLRRLREVLGGPDGAAPTGTGSGADADASASRGAKR